MQAGTGRDLQSGRIRENGLQEMNELLYDMNTLDSRCVGNELRSSFFDSIEEEKFYHDLIKLLDKYHYSELQVDVHVHLSELFTNSFSFCNLSSLTFRSIVSSILLAGVPTRGENINVNALSYLQ